MPSIFVLWIGYFMFVVGLFFHKLGILCLSRAYFFMNWVFYACWGLIFYELSILCLSQGYFFMNWVIYVGRRVVFSWIRYFMFVAVFFMKYVFYVCRGRVFSWIGYFMFVAGLFSYDFGILSLLHGRFLPIDKWTSNKNREQHCVKFAPRSSDLIWKIVQMVNTCLSLK